MSISSVISSPFRARTRRRGPVTVGLLAAGLLLGLVAPLPAPAVETGTDPQGAAATTSPPAASPQGQGQPAAPPPPPPPKMSILLLMDVSGSMNDNNKIEAAKKAAISAIDRALATQIPQASLTQLPAAVSQPAMTSALANSPIPGIPPLIAQKFVKNLDALAEIQKLLGPNIRDWVTKSPAKDMGKILKSCEKLMEGLAFEQKSILMQRLNPLVEKMHYSIAAKVNETLRARGLSTGLKYVIPGKTPAHGEFGGLFTLKPSDHDAIYLGEGADEAVKLHKELAKTYGDDFLNLTESCLESSKYTLEKVARGARPEAFQKFSGPMSNLDWMRSKTGSGWVERYVDKAGTVVDLDDLDDVAKIGKPGQPGSAMRSLASYTDDELEALGVVMDRSVAPPPYNLGLHSDFERQLALNKARKGLEKGLATSTADDTAMLMSKYGPRYQEVLDGAGVQLEQTAWKGYTKQLEAVGKKAKAGTALDAADQAVIDKFDDFAGFVRQQSMGRQVQEFAKIKQGLIDATKAGDTAAVTTLKGQMTDLVDDTQAALHNYRQLYGKDFVDDLVTKVTSVQDDFGRGLQARLIKKPWVVNEKSIDFCVRKELAAQGKVPDPGSTVPKTAVISDSQSLWQYARQNPGHVFAKAAQYGAYAWMGYEILSKVHEGKDAEALETAAMFAGTEGGVRLANYVLQAKYGAWAGPGVVLAAAGGYAIGNMAAQWAIDSQVDEMSLQMMSGYSNDGSRTFGDPSLAHKGGMLAYLSQARPTKVENPATGQSQNWTEFDAPSEASNLSDEQIMSRFKPGTYGDSTMQLDANGNVVIETQTTRWQRAGYGAGSADFVEVPHTETKTIPKSQIVAHTRLQQMYQTMRGKYNDALAQDVIQPGSQNVPSDFAYVDPNSDIPGSQFTIPNGGKMTMHEFTFYRSMFERTWSRWSLDKNAQFNQTWTYWGANMENAYKAKWSMFKSFMASVSQGKKKDREFQEKLAKDSPENLVALKLLAEQGMSFFVDGKKLTADDIQKMIDKKLEARQKVLDEIKDGVIQVELPEDLEALLAELSAMTLGDIEIGIMPYSGGCSSTFSLFGFSRIASELKAAIESLSAGGGTPMSPALYQARYALLKHGKGQAGTIILLCDGQNDCRKNDPVKAAENIRTSTFTAATGGLASRLMGSAFRFQLVPAAYAQVAAAPTFVPIDLNDPIPQARRSIPVTVSTVGFQVSRTQQDVLDAIAAAGGGIAGSAQDMAQLTQAFSSAIRSAGSGFSGGGGGGYVAARRTASWPLVTGLMLLLGSLVLGIAILVLVRGRGALGPVAPIAHLHLAYADGGTKSCTIRGRTSLGRASSNDLVLRDDEVSARHAELVPTGEGLLLRDLGSRNGTFVNGQATQERLVVASDVIRVGGTTLTVSA